MVFIPFPREEFDDDADLAVWRAKQVKRPDDWKSLRDFLARQPRLMEDLHPTPKCWYSELPQGDPNARDVEHFRPKNRASPLNKRQVRVLEQKTGFTLLQAHDMGAYPWLEFDYRNYRLVTALTNRGGAKHIYFPLAQSTHKLPDGTFAWETPEYPYLLDPTSPHDASLLIVKPNGEIIPRVPKTPLTDADFANLPATWHSDGFNYIRAEVTIQLYRLNHRVFQEGRKEVYNKITRVMELLQYCLPDDDDRRVQLKKGFINDLAVAISPSAPFALAARSALEAYLAPTELDTVLKEALEGIARQILERVKTEVAAKQIAWDRP